MMSGERSIMIKVSKWASLMQCCRHGVCICLIGALWSTSDVGGADRCDLPPLAHSRVFHHMASCMWVAARLGQVAQVALST